MSTLATEISVDYMLNEIKLNPRLNGIKKAASVTVAQLISD